MASRDPLWYCHQCHAEMQPLMVPDPVCASCRGTFVEKMDNSADDPRDFGHSGRGNSDGEYIPPEIDSILLGLQSIMDQGRRRDPSRTPRQDSRNLGSGTRLTFQIRSTSGQQGTIISDDGSSSGHDLVPTMSEYIRRGSTPSEGGITGQLMAQYLMALIGNRGPRDPFTNLFGGIGDPTSGRLGDYVFNQEALDQIMSQLMESSNVNRPVPATEQVITDLDREVLEQGSHLLERDCAVCKEQFKLETEDPDEQIVITLPCTHPFHEPCILPWLKSSGTCPVCRHALVPQPGQQPSLPSSSSPANFRDSPRRHRSPGRSSRSDTNGSLQSWFGAIIGSADSGRNSSSSQQSRSTSNPSSRSSNRRNTRDHIPGSWNDDLD